MRSQRILHWRLTTVLLFLSLSLFSQNQLGFGLLPRMNLSSQITGQSQVVFGAESRFQSSNNAFDHALTDLKILFSQRVGLRSKVNAGYLIRFRDGVIFHRLIQQYGTVRKLNQSRISHRIASDQTFSSATDPIFRLRYRAVWEIPLSGDKINWKELYFKTGGEILGIFQPGSADMEIRILPAVGYELNSNNKLEMGLDYRMSKLLANRVENKLWASLTWYFIL